jgi:hypothetical protein
MLTRPLPFHRLWISQRHTSRMFFSMFPRFPYSRLLHLLLIVSQWSIDPVDMAASWALREAESLRYVLFPLDQLWIAGRAYYPSPSWLWLTQFVNLVSGSELGVGNGLESHTSIVQPGKPFILDGRRVVLIDTPGFDDTTRSDVDVLNTIALFLATL